MGCFFGIYLTLLLNSILASIETTESYISNNFPLSHLIMWITGLAGIIILTSILGKAIILPQDVLHVFFKSGIYQVFAFSMVFFIMELIYNSDEKHKILRRLIWLILLVASLCSQNLFS